MVFNVLQNFNNHFEYTYFILRYPSYTPEDTRVRGRTLLQVNSEMFPSIEYARFMVY